MKENALYLESFFFGGGEQGGVLLPPKSGNSQQNEIPFKTVGCQIPIMPDRYRTLYMSFQKYTEDLTVHYSFSTVLN